MTAGTNAGNEVVKAFGEIVENFLRSSTCMYFYVGRIIKLLWYPGIRILLLHFMRSFYSAFHAFLTWRQFKGSTISTHQFSSFHTHAFGHYQYQLITFYCSYE